MRALVCLLATILILLYTNVIAIADDSNGETYPHITLLESTILGQSFTGDPLATRLARMEKQAFGSESNNPSLSDRTDALDDYVEQHLHKQVVRTDAEADAAADGEDLPEQNQAEQNQTAQSPGDYPRVTALEDAILNHEYTGQPLVDRLSRMEVTAFGKASGDPDLSARTDALENYAEKKLHKKPINSVNEEASANTTNSPNNQQNSGKTKELFSKVGHTLLGMTGLGMPGTPFGQGGLYSNKPPEKPEPQPEIRKEDPAITASTPPEPGARLLTKVGWCEMQVFGQTYPNMHLPERLGQLNQKLNFEPNKSNVELMDDIGVMIKSIQAQKPIASNSSQALPSAK